MLTLLLIIFLIWAFVKLGTGTLKILFFLLACGFVFVFFIHLLVPLIILGAIIFIAFALLGS